MHFHYKTNSQEFCLLVRILLFWYEFFQNEFDSQLFPPSMDYGRASFHIFWKCISMFLGGFSWLHQRGGFHWIFSHSTNTREILIILAKCTCGTHVSKIHNNIFIVSHMFKNQSCNDSMGVSRNQQLPRAFGETRCQWIANDNMHWRVLQSNGT
jgi:hypothetical protein